MSQISEKTTVPLGWVLTGFFVSLSTLVSITVWAAHIQDGAAATAGDVLSLKQQITQVMGDVRQIREAEIRIEAHIGLEPSYKKGEKTK